MPFLYQETPSFPAAHCVQGEPKTRCGEEFRGDDGQHELEEGTGKSSPSLFAASY